MMQLLIICIVFFFGFVGWELSMTSPKGKLNIDENDDVNNFVGVKVAPPNIIQNDTEQKQTLPMMNPQQEVLPEYISIPQQMRRVQASLKEYSKGLIKKDEEQLLRDKEQSILQQLLVLGERHVGVSNLIADLRMKEVDLFSREKSTENKIEVIKMLHERVQLEKQDLENARRSAVLDIKEERHEVEKEKTLLGFANERLDLNNLFSEIIQRENVLELDLRKQGIQEATLQLMGKELNHKDALLDFKSEKISLEELAVTLLKRESIVEISEQNLELKGFGIELTQREKNAELREGKISLSEQMLNLMADKNTLEEGKRMLHA